MAEQGIGRATRALAVAGVTGVLIAVASPAVADEITVETAGWEWFAVHDTAFGVSDATAFHRDVLGSGVQLKGWTEDAFDAYDGVGGFLGGIGFDHATPNLGGEVFPTPVSFEAHPDGGATVVSEVSGWDLGSGAFLDMVVTLDIEGSFARWTIDVDDDGSGLVESVWASGDAGSATTATQVGPNGLVISGPPGLGPMIGLHVESDGTLDVFDGSDPEFPYFQSDGASRIVVTLALLDYDPCAEGDALAAMADLVPEFPSRFGEDLAPVLSDCVAVDQAAPMEVANPTDQLLPVTFTGALAGGHPRLDGDSYVDHLETWTQGLGVLAPDLPAGLTLAVEDDPVTQQPVLRLSGVPTVAFSGEVPLRLYGIRDQPDFSGEMPVAATLRLDIEGLDITNPEPGGGGGGGTGELPPTGAAGGPWALLAASVAVALGLTLRRVRVAPARRGRTAS